MEVLIMMRCIAQLALTRQERHLLCAAHYVSLPLVPCFCHASRLKHIS